MRRWLVPGAFLLAAVFTGVHAANVGQVAIEHPSSRHVLLAIYAALRTIIALAFAGFTVERAEPHRRSREPIAFAACAIAMLAVVVVTQPSRNASPTRLAVGDFVAVIGCVGLLLSVLTLGRCFGVLPEARGFVHRGPYKLVRHPVYVGEIVALGGLAIAAPAAVNIVVFGIFVLAQIVRTRLEESALIAAFPEYVGYAGETGRLFPLVGRLPSATSAHGKSAAPTGVLAVVGEGET